MNKNIPLPVLIIYAVLLATSCKSTPEAGKNSDLVLRQSGDTVVLNADYPSKNKIIIGKINYQKYTYSFTTTGVVRPLTGHLAEISAPFEGRITNGFVSLGEKISKGAPLFGMTSQEYNEAVRNFQQSAKEKETAQKNFNRKKDLLDQGIVSKKDFDDASLSLEIAQKEYDKAGSNLKIFNIDPETADFSHPLIISSPIAGEVVSLNLTLGQYLKADSEPVAVIANLDKVWIVAHIKEKDLGKISLKDQVDIVTESLAENPFRGTVEYIGNIMEDQTRSVEVFIECTNVDKLIKPGMFVTVHFRRNIENALIIPSTALLQDENRTFVFVKISDNIYCKKTVVSTSLENRQLLIKSGLTAGDVIIFEGGIYLR